MNSDEIYTQAVIHFAAAFISNPNLSGIRANPLTPNAPGQFSCLFDPIPAAVELADKLFAHLQTKPKIESLN